jgi:hypothetical protein
VTADPSDDDIEANLRAGAVDAWQNLWRAFDRFEREVEHGRWEGGQQIDATVVDGVERPVYQMPYVRYSDAVEAIVRALYDAGAVVPFAWHDWDGMERYHGGDALMTAPVADAVRVLTAVIRSDRFCEGSLKGAVDDGTIGAALRRLRAWYEDRQPRSEG